MTVSNIGGPAIGIISRGTLNNFMFTFIVKQTTQLSQARRAFRADTLHSIQDSINTRVQIVNFGILKSNFTYFLVFFPKHFIVINMIPIKDYLWNKEVHLFLFCYELFLHALEPGRDPPGSN